MKSGILPICKPEGLSSARVVSLVKKISGAKKVGHMGTLDPFATGLLLCGIDKGTRISQFFLNGTKKYKAKICLGIETDTFDCTGIIVQKADSLDAISKEKIIELINEFKGQQKQIPPAYSALKHKGKPLYKYAREGRKISKPAREIEIFEISIEKIEIPFIHIDVLCSAGTYIRTIAHDVGKKLGYGAHLAALSRTETCGFSLEDSLDLNDLEKMDTSEIDKKIIPLTQALFFMPAHIADIKLENKIRFGQKIDFDDGLPKCDGFLRILTKTEELAAIVEYDKTNCEFNYCCVFSN
ncbi:MAG: tRNA pseudouridine(55) synthase TruB [Desulfobacteraceae bacterium]|nr:tRNA pseudouridine(55) synthase TruB [Desulfobacteraceae bacterium]MCK5543284.1 tRNA pseudouridine(55) synthase TruB [Desulfobacterales bacterium]